MTTINTDTVLSVKVDDTFRQNDSSNRTYVVHTTMLCTLPQLVTLLNSIQGERKEND